MSVQTQMNISYTNIVDLYADNAGTPYNIQMWPSLQKRMAHKTRYVIILYISPHFLVTIYVIHSDWKYCFEM